MKHDSAVLQTARRRCEVKWITVTVGSGYKFSSPQTSSVRVIYREPWQTYARSATLRCMVEEDTLLTWVQKESGSSGSGRGAGGSSGPSGSGQGSGGRGQRAPEDNKNVKVIGSAEQFKKEVSGAGDRLVRILPVASVLSCAGRCGLVCRMVWSLSADGTSVCITLCKVHECCLPTRRC